MRSVRSMPGNADRADGGPRTNKRFGVADPGDRRAPTVDARRTLRRASDRAAAPCCRGHPRQRQRADRPPRPLGVDRPAPWHHRPSRLVGRDDVLHDLDVLVSGPWDVPPATVVLEGAPGLGKTALVNTVLPPRRAAPTCACAARPWRPPGDLVDLRGPRAVRRADPGGGADQRSRPFDDAPARGHRRLGPRAGRSCSARSKTTCSTSSRGDRCWSPSTTSTGATPRSIAFLHYLVRRVEIHPVRFVMSMVPRHARLSLTPLDRLLHESSARRLTLQPLTLVDVEEFLTMTLGVSSDARVAAEYHHATGGNPFLLSALLSDIDRRHPPGVDELLAGLDGDALPRSSARSPMGSSPSAPPPGTRSRRPSCSATRPGRQHRRAHRCHALDGRGGCRRHARARPGQARLAAPARAPPRGVDGAPDDPGRPAPAGRRARRHVARGGRRTPPRRGSPPRPDRPLGRRRTGVVARRRGPAGRGRG